MEAECRFPPLGPERFDSAEIEVRKEPLPQNGQCSRQFLRSLHLQLAKQEIAGASRRPDDDLAPAWLEKLRITRFIDKKKGSVRISIRSGNGRIHNGPSG